MKNLNHGIFCILLILSFHSSYSQAKDRVKFYFMGFLCNNETWDNALEFDGKGDEVYFKSNILIANGSGAPKLNSEFRSEIYGDVNGYNNRIQVGTRSTKGGIRTGDSYYTNRLIGDYELDNDDVCMITPTLWEWDGQEDLFNSFSNTFQQNLVPLAQALVSKAQQAKLQHAEEAAMIVDAIQQGYPLLRNFVVDIIGQAKDRPIGIDAQGTFSPKTLTALTINSLKYISNSENGYGKGVVGIQYSETGLGNHTTHGDYTLLVRIEFIAKAVALPINGTTQQPVSSPPVKKIITDPQMKRSNTIFKGSEIKLKDMNSTVSLVGTWIGTSGSGENSGSDYYAFNLTKEGTFQQVNQNGEVVGTGSYKFENNMFTATYDTKWLKNIMSIGTITANQLSGTWKLNGASGGGKWVVTKK